MAEFDEYLQSMICKELYFICRVFGIFAGECSSKSVLIGKIKKQITKAEIQKFLLKNTYKYYCMYFMERQCQHKVIWDSAGQCKKCDMHIIGCDDPFRCNHQNNVYQYEYFKNPFILNIDTKDLLSSDIPRDYDDEDILEPKKNIIDLLSGDIPDNYEETKFIY